MWEEIKCTLRLRQPQRQDFQKALQDTGLPQSSEHEAQVNTTCLHDGIYPVTL